MPNLPTITITDQALFDRVVAVFGTADAYKTWLKTVLRQEVLDREILSVRTAASADTSLDNGMT